MRQSSWLSARRTTATLTAGEVILLASAGVLARALDPTGAAFLAGAALAPFLSFVSVLAMHGSRPLRAGRFLLRLVVARAAGAFVAGGTAALLHVALGLAWMPLVAGFAVAALLGLILHPWLVHAAARRASSWQVAP